MTQTGDHEITLGNLDQANTLPQEKIDIIDQLLESSEEQLDEAGKSSATQAFNLGCSIGMIPAGLIIFVTFIATQSWFAALISAILMVIALISCANLLALIARSKTVERVYRDEIYPKFQNTLEQEKIDENDFKSYVWQNIPTTTNIYQVFPKPPAAETRPKRKRIKRFAKNQ